MEFIDAYPMHQIDQVPSPGKLYSQLMDLIVRLAHAGLIHGDYNEFNILIRRSNGEPVVIDFPQMVSTSHENAEWYFNRDVECIRAFFRRRFKYESAIYPRFKGSIGDGGKDEFRLDVVVEASGFGRREMKVLEQYAESVKESQSHTESEPDGDSDEEEEEDEDEDGGDEVEDTSRGEDSEQAEDESSGDPEGSGAAAADSILESESEGEGPPRSATVSPPGQVVDKDQENSRSGNAGWNRKEIRDKAAIDAYKERARQKQKYHSRRGAERIGRAKGSKSKQDNRVKLWD